MTLFETSLSFRRNLGKVWNVSFRFLTKW